MSSEQKAPQSGRIFNFSAGPATLPLAVLEEAQRDLVDYKGAGMSVLEMSHRSKTYDSIIKQTEADIRELLGIPENYKVLFLQGGASLQFSMVPMNLLPAGGSADYVVTGSWSESAVKEAKKLGTVNVAATTKAGNFTRVPRQDEYTFDANAAYLHYTSNETIHGVEFREEPEFGAGATTLVCDASSDFMSRPIDVARYGLIYAGAQKNIGPAGLVVVIASDEVIARRPDNMPAMLDYKLQAEKESLYNTPPAFAIYVCGLVMKWLKDLGGLGAIQRMNEEKAAILYDAIDATEFYRGHAEPESRSLMNVTFRLPSEELEKKFASEATTAGLDGLKGHRSVGGLRASIYNAFPADGVRALVDFMREFERVNG
jgi:phosphoserine aminotransferase